MSLTIAATSYEPNDARDRELAACAATAIAGYADDRPVTTALVASRLRPLGDVATRLVIASEGGKVVGWAALRGPSDGTPARLWGPIVCLKSRRRGVGTTLLTTILSSSDIANATAIETAEVPRARTEALAFFSAHGWRPVRHGAVLRHDLTGDVTKTTTPGFDIVDLNGARFDGGRAVAGLFKLAHPDATDAFAAKTLDRWRSDARFSSNLLLFALSGSRPVGMVLTLPIFDADGGSEVLVTEPSVALDGERQSRVMADLVREACARGASRGASRARAVLHDSQLDYEAAFASAGFRRVDASVIYTTKGDASRLHDERGAP